MKSNRVRTWTVISFLALGLFMGFGLYNQALFFTPIQTYYMTGLALFGFVVTIILGGWRLRMPVWVMIAFGYAVYTFLTTLWAANAGLAVEGAVTTAACVLVALLMTVLSDRTKRYLINMIAIAGPLAYLFGLASRFNLINYTSAYMADQTKNIIMNSVFQYHNTFGAFELLTLVLSVGLVDLAAKWWQRGIYLFLAGLSLVGILSSYSREVWVLLPVAAVLLTVAERLRRRMARTAIHVLYALIAGGAGAPFAIPALSHASKHDGLIAVIAVMAVALLVAYLDATVGKVLKTRSSRIGVGAGVAVVVVAAMIFLVHHEASKLTSITSRLSSIQLKDFSVQQRLLFYQAALHMMQGNPLFGSGFGTWTAKFLAYQQYPYEATLVHSVVMENLLNVGIVGFILWVGLIVFSVVSGVRYVRRSHDTSAVPLIAMVGAITMLLHGTFDFDFTFPVIEVIFFLLLGMGAKPQPQLVEEAEYKQRWSKSEATGEEKGPHWIGVASPIMNIVMGAASCVAIIVGGMMSAAEHLYTKATTTDQASPTLEEADLQKAIAWAPYYPKPYAKLATAQMTQLQSSSSSSTQSTQQSAQAAWQTIQSAAAKDPWNANTQATMATYAYQLGQQTQALAWAKRAAKDSPFNVQYPETYMAILLWTNVTHYQGNKTAADKGFQEIIGQLTFAQSSVKAQSKMKFGYAPSWTYQVDAPMMTYAGAAEYALGNYTTSLSDVTNLPSTNSSAQIQALADVVTLLDNERLHPGYTNAKISKVIASNPAYKQEYQVLSALHPLKK